MSNVNKENFLQNLKNKYGNKYILIGEFIGYSKNTLFKDTSLKRKNYIYETPKNIINGNFSKLGYFNGKENIPKEDTIEKPIDKDKELKNKIKNEQFIKRVRDKFGDVYNFLEVYKGSNIKIKIQHKCKDGEWFTWLITPSNLLHGKGLCPKCSNKSVGTEEFKRKIFKKYGDEYIVLGEYRGSFEFVLMKHNTKDCDCEFLVKPNRILFCNVACPKCFTVSKGENYIKNILINNSIPYDKQYVFKNCKFKIPLRFDFAVFEDLEKNNIKYLIEYQGIQHYKPQRFNGISQEKAEINFEEQKIKDKIKVDYCIKNNIKLLIIPYWQYDDIEKILDNYK